MNGRDMDYDFGQKRHWRRTLWNQIAERVSMVKTGGPKLYLGGMEDHDRRVMGEKGIVDSILIDRDRRVVDEARKGGKLAVRADLLSVLGSWPKTPAVRVLVGDFCGGLSLGRLQALVRSLLLVPALRGTVVAFNFLRGRDATTNELRKKVGCVTTAPDEVHEDFLRRTGTNDMELKKLIRHIESPYLKTIKDLRMHRGWHLYFSWRDVFVMQALGKNEAKGGFTTTKADMNWLHFVYHTYPIFFSYKSTAGQVFDTVVALNGVFFLPGYGESGCLQHERKSPEWDPRVGRQVSAVLAHRTMRMRGGNHATV